MAKLKTATAVGALVDMIAANEALKDELAQFETETLELKAALQDTVVDDYGYARDAFFNGMGNRKEYDRILAALAQPAIAKLPEAKDDGS